ncbi:hypothetical protein ACFWWA_17000 [Streptomyces goshikiensis]|uniref:hypothetical protein n=1 Tax=Streptomyces goshikiensis TaxID=1942 RepID=UPI0036625387
MPARLDGDAVDEPGRLVRLAVDGKTVRGSRVDGHAVHPLAAAALHDSQTVIAQRQGAAKSNEISAFVPLLEHPADHGVTPEAVLNAFNTSDSMASGEPAGAAESDPPALATGRHETGGGHDMGLILLLLALIVALAVALVALAVILTASAGLGLATAALSRRLPLWARITLLLTLAAAPAAALVSLLDVAAVWQLAAWALPFLTTVASGAAWLAFESYRRREPRLPKPAWLVRHAPAAGR